MLSLGMLWVSGFLVEHLHRVTCPGSLIARGLLVTDSRQPTLLSRDSELIDGVLIE